MVLGSKTLKKICETNSGAGCRRISTVRGEKGVSRLGFRDFGAGLRWTCTTLECDECVERYCEEEISFMVQNERRSIQQRDKCLWRRAGIPCVQRDTRLATPELPRHYPAISQQSTKIAKNF